MNILKFIDNVNIFTGRIFRWAGLILSLVVLYEVFSRYCFNSPTVWAYDTALMLYSMLFLLGGGYVLWEHKHVRVDVLYDQYSPRGQALADIIFYIIFFFPFVIVMVWFGSKAAYWSTLAGEISNTSQWGEPIWPWRWMLPLGFFLLLLQGLAECYRAIIRFKEGV